MSDQPTPNPWVCNAPKYVPGAHKIAGHDDIAILSANENPFGPAPKINDFLQNQPHPLHRYPDGSASALGEKLAAIHNIAQDQIIIGAGSDEIITLLMRAYAAVGKSVVYTQHGFLMYKIAATCVGASPIVAPEDNRRLSVDNILRTVDDTSCMVCLANPNNPTGDYLPIDEITRLVENLPQNCLLMLDAAYCEYCDADDYNAGLGLVADHANVIVTRTFSKIYGLASLRLGWAYGPKQIIENLHRVRSPFNVSQLAQDAGSIALDCAEHIEKSYRHNIDERNRLSDQLRQYGIGVMPSQGNFLLCDFHDTQTAHKAFQHCLGQGIVLRTLDAYGLSECLRITIGTKRDNDRTLASLQTFMRGT